MSAMDTRARRLQRGFTFTEVIVVSQFIGCPLPCASYQISDPWQLIALFEDLGVEAAVFHFGIRYELFNALWLLGVSTTRCAVHFHNVTPPDLAEEPVLLALFSGVRVGVWQTPTNPIRFFVYLYWFVFGALP